MYDVAFLKRARELCDQYDVLLIFDEVDCPVMYLYADAASHHPHFFYPRVFKSFHELVRVLDVMKAWFRKR